MPRILVYILYNLFLPLLLLIGLPSFLIKGIRRGGLARGFAQRLGFLSVETLAPLGGRRPLWIHAVSVGEVLIALKLIEALRSQAPDLPILLSTTTTTGYRVAAEKQRDGLAVIHNPVDLPWTVWSTIHKLDPLALVLIESEIWPNLIGTLRRRSVPVWLVNARLSPRSERRYRKARAWVAPLLSQLSGVTAPFPEDRERWASLGVDPTHIDITGSIKFDSAGGAAVDEALYKNIAKWLSETGMPDSARVLLGASTHDGEELLLANSLRTLRRDFPQLELVLVPRHAERGADIATQLRSAGFSPILRSEKPSHSSRTDTQGDAQTRGKSHPEPDAHPIWIANTTGELRTWYQFAEFVVVGKSFRGGGGQNPVEPIFSQRPVVVGPKMENFAEPVAELLRVQGLRQIGGDDELVATLAEFLHDPAAGVEMARRGEEAMTPHVGAAARNARWILRHLSGLSNVSEIRPHPGLDRSHTDLQD